VARLEYRESFSGACSPEQAQLATVRYLGSIGARMNAVSPTYIEAATGSQLALRMKGGLFADKSDYPVRTSVTISPTPEGCRIDVTCVDELGVGFKVGLRKGYQSAFQARVTDLRKAVAEQGQPDAPLPAPPPPDRGGTEGDLAQQIAHLTDLHRSGALTDEEFARAKAKLLGS
jgi:hypothetical protein